MTRIWHAFWLPHGVGIQESDPRLFLWGEALDLASRPEGDGAKLYGTNGAIAHHPHALTPDALASDFQIFEFDAPSEGQVILNLPTVGGAPLSSTVHANDLSQDSVSFRNWSIPGFVLDPLRAVDLLSSLPETLPPGLKLGDTMRFWIEGTKFLLDLLSRGRFLPGLVRHGENFRGQWRLLFADARDQERLDILVDGIPSALEAALPRPSPARELLHSFLEECGDSLIRTFTSRLQLFEPDDEAPTTARHIPGKRWFTALTSAERIVGGMPFEFMSLEQRLRKWSHRLLTDATAGSAVLHFELISPPPGEEPNPIWQLRIEVELITEGKKRVAIDELQSTSPLPLPFEELELQLLHDLGRATHVFPPLIRALGGLHPTHLELNTVEAYRFLSEAAITLGELGFQVTLPSWWKKTSADVGLQLSVTRRQANANAVARHSALGLSELLDFSWSMVLGGEELGIDHFREIVSQHTPLIQAGNQWIEIDPGRASKTLQFIEEQRKRPGLAVVDALRFGLGGSIPEDLLPVLRFHAEGWISKLLERSADLVREIEQPELFNGHLRPYQLEGLAWLSFLTRVGVGGCLADDMGLGKTIQFLALLLHERMTAEPSSRPAPTLLIVPMSILENWQRETHRFAPSLRTLLHHGQSRLVGAAFVREAEASDLVVTTYSLAYRDEALLSKLTWSRIALDEAQSIKNLATKQTQSIRRLMQQQLERGHACHRIALTGTPLENHLEELWSIFDFLNPGYLGTLGEFRRQFAIPIERYRDSVVQTRLSKMISPFVLRRLKRDPKIIEDLPEKIEVEEFISLFPEQAALYQRILNQMLPAVDSAVGVHRKGLVLATITRLKQICDHPSLALKDGGPLDGRSGKLARLTELCETLIEEGDKILIFTQYAQMGDLLQRFLSERFGQDVPFLHGSLAQGARMKLVDRFQGDPAVQMFVLSLKAGGLGLNLTAANQVVHYDQWWNPAVEQQATDRAYRIGQKRNVQVRKLICKGTLEEKIAELLFRKRDLAENIVGATKNMITEMSTAELRGLLGLSASSLEYNELREQP